MLSKLIIRAASACLVVASFNVSAIPTSVDYLTVGDGLITRDSNQNLEFLDLTYTQGRTYNDISSKFGVGKEFEGWRYAFEWEIESLLYSFGGLGNYNGWSAVNSGLFDIVAPVIGNPGCTFSPGCDETEGTIYGLYGEFLFLDPNKVRVARFGDYDQDPLFAYANQDFFDTRGDWQYRDSTDGVTASFLVRSVPEPSIIFLMVSGFLAFGAVRPHK